MLMVPSWAEDGNINVKVSVEILFWNASLKHRDNSIIVATPFRPDMGWAIATAVIRGNISG